MVGLVISPDRQAIVTVSLSGRNADKLSHSPLRAQQGTWLGKGRKSDDAGDGVKTPFFPKHRIIQQRLGLDSQY